MEHRSDMEVTGWLRKELQQIALGNVDTSTTCPEAPESEKKCLHITVPGSDGTTLVQITGPMVGWSGTDPAGNPLPDGVL